MFIEFEGMAINANRIVSFRKTMTDMGKPRIILWMLNEHINAEMRSEFYNTAEEANQRYNELMGKLNAAN